MRKPVLIVLAVILLAAGAGGGWHWWKVSRFLQSTDDAYVQSDVSLISPTSDALIDIARAHGAIGWKVNGAGGDGGTVTLLGSDDPVQFATMQDQLAAAAHPGHLIAHTVAAAGVRVEVYPSGR